MSPWSATSAQRVGRRLAVWSCGLLLALTLTAIGLHAQNAAPPAVKQTDALPAASSTFDVISIRPTDPKNLALTTRPNPENFIMTGAPLTFLIQYAYDLHDFQVEGGPAWINSTRFDVVAKMDALPAGDAGVPRPQRSQEDREKILETRLRALLADRFNLHVHSATKEMPVYALEVDKGGPKLQASVENSGSSSGPGMLKFSNTSMEGLASALADQTNRIVQDRTGISGGFAVTLKWNPDESAAADPATPGLFTALQEQLGLKLVSTKGSVPVLVIDHVDMPVGN